MGDDVDDDDESIKTPDENIDMHSFEVQQKTHEPKREEEEENINE